MVHLLNTVHTIGHSNRSIADFLALLRANSITAIADIRSQPYSRLYPQFSRAPLEFSLSTEGIHYIFLGKELGARSDDPACYENNTIRYDRLAKTPLFQQGLDRIQAGLARDFNIAILCAEKEPLHCHRTIMVSRRLVERGVAVKHIVDETNVEDHQQTMARLLQSLSLDSMHLFKTSTQVLDMAYEIQGERIAYRKDEPERQES
jgi:uncharacterized protein (DUF488 family)